MSSVYCFDTNAILTAWNETYRPASFEGFWRGIEGLIAGGRAFICEEVKRELAKKDDDVSAWVEAQSAFVVPLEERQIEVVRQLVKEYPALAKERLGRMRADGFVIGLALLQSHTVVTAENRRGPEKIPNICEAKRVTCLSLADMIEAEQWRF